MSQRDTVRYVIRNIAFNLIAIRNAGPLILLASPSFNAQCQLQTTVRIPLLGWSCGGVL